MPNRQAHWDRVYHTKDHTRVSWFKTDCKDTLEQIISLGLPKTCAIIDVGAGASQLVDTLLKAGYENITALDIANQGLSISKQRLGQLADKITWLCDDITTTQQLQKYDLWHDRAALHFLTSTEDQQRYVQQLRQHLNPGAYALLATFAINGPEKCSDLMIEQYDATKLLSLLGSEFEMLSSDKKLHMTPAGSEQLFQHCLVRFNGGR